MSAANRRFCSVENRELGEPVVGKGGPAQPHLLLTWPRRKWTDHVFAARDMPEFLAEQLEALRDQGWRVQLIDRLGHDHGRRQLLVPLSGKIYQAPNQELPALLDAMLQSEESAAPWHFGQTVKKVLLCCTHGKKDRCCAKFGNAAYQAIVAENAAGGYGFDVWESTHVGGCRLAANVVSLPEVRRYGRITPDDVPAFLASERGGRPYLPCFRGSTDLNGLQQCADLAAREWLTERSIDAEIRVEAVEDPDAPAEKTVTVHWRSGLARGALLIACHAQELTGYGNCNKLARGEAQALTGWWARSVTELAADEVAPCG